jgi:hypothetical protein
MQKSPQYIASEIKHLLDQLVNMATSSPSTPAKSQPVKTKGASGALSILAQEGFFDSPMDITAIMNKLQEMGRHYDRSLVSMNLLNLTRRRTFTRIKDNKTKTWQYVIRK